MTLRDLMAQHALQFVNLAHLGEVATYRPHNGEDDRQVRCVVNREPLSFLGDNPDDTATIQQATVFLPLNDTHGITTVDEGDQILIPIRYGQPAIWCRVQEELSSGPHGFIVRVVA